MPINLLNLEDAATAMRYAVSKRTENCYLEATCASGGDSNPEYNRFIALTQRIVRNDTIVGYICYRIKHPKKDKHVTFSSYEIYDASFDRLTSVKIHVDPSDPRGTFDAVLALLLNRLK